MNESVFVADLQSGNPPVLHVGVIPIGNVYRAPTTKSAFVAMVEILQSMKIVKIPND